MSDHTTEFQSIKSTLVSRNITVLGKRTSVRLEPEMWNALREISKKEDCRIHDICSLIQLRKNPNTSLTAAIRVFLMLYFKAACTEEGHRKAGHGNFRHMMDRAQMDHDLMSSLRNDDKAPARSIANAPLATPAKKKKELSSESEVLKHADRAFKPCYKQQVSVRT